jgi:hypothetical protein
MIRSVISNSATALVLFIAIVITPVATGQAPSVTAFKIHLAAPASAGLPVWIQAELPERLSARYPYATDPSSFGPNKLELKLDGQLLAPLSFETVPSGGGILDGSIAPPGSPQNRLPLHLRYALDRPGNYSVRWTVVRHELSAATKQFSEITVAQSDWLVFVLRPSTREQREAWLAEELVGVPTDPGLIVGDFLPSLLSQAPDPRALRAAMEQSYAKSDAVSAYALGCIYRFPDRDVQAETMEIIHKRGPSETLAYLIALKADLFKSDAGEISRAVLPYLNSRDDSEVAASLKTLMFVLHPPASKATGDPGVQKTADDAVMAAAPELLMRGLKVTGPLAEFLGGVRTSNSRNLLWQMVIHPGVPNVQAQISLTSIANRDDLPKLGEWLIQPGDQDPMGSDRVALVHALKRGYGDSAVSFLEKAVVDSPYDFVRFEAAKELIVTGSPVAFQFFLDTVNQNQFYKTAAIQWLVGQFPKELSASSDDAAVIAFLKARLRQ